MVNKETTDINDLFYVLDFFMSFNKQYWLDGGWGVDALYGKQSREHRDIDIDFDAAITEQVLDKLLKEGYKMETDELPVRAELYSPEHGYLDIHPFKITDERICQANPDGGFFEFEKSWFSETIFMGKKIPCISLSGQFVFHSGYELRTKDYLDLKILELLKSDIS